MPRGSPRQRWLFRSLSSVSVPLPPLLLPHQRDHDTLDFQLARWDQFWIPRIFRFQIRPATLYHVALERRFAVDQRRHDIAVVHLFTVFQNHNVAIDDVRADPAVARG